jgi:O-antigen/teichoic acid export membrane protein
MPGLLRASLTLLAGGAMAQALPLLLGPWLTRLYSPAEFGLYQLFAAVAANLAVVACGRYEFALPLARDTAQADALRRLALRIAATVSAVALSAGIAWAAWRHSSWPLWLGPSVAALGLASLATLWATRAQRFRALAWARVIQQGGGAVGQALAGSWQAGVQGLIVAPLLAALGAVACLRLPLRMRPAGPGPRLRDTARQFREFPLLNTPHAFASALQDTVALALLAAILGPAAAGFWGLALRYLKAPATLVGSAVSQALYPQLAQAGVGVTQAGRTAVRRVMLALGVVAAVLVLALWMAGPWLFGVLFGPAWLETGVLARALALYIGAHFVASPLAVVTMAWGAQAWALRLALVGQLMFVAALGLGLHLGGLAGAGWAVSLAMALYFGFYFARLATWPLSNLPPTLEGDPA